MLRRASPDEAREGPGPAIGRRSREVVSVRQIQISKSASRAARRRDLLSEDYLPLDPRDPDIVRAKELARRRARSCAQEARRRSAHS
jgi:hypothetical protein